MSITMIPCSDMAYCTGRNAEFTCGLRLSCARYTDLDALQYEAPGTLHQELDLGYPHALNITRGCILYLPQTATDNTK